MKVSMSNSVYPFAVIGRNQVSSVIAEAYDKIEAVVVNAYQKHHSGRTINPDSYFLRFRDAPQNRIIALPAHIAGETNVSGIKWIASYPNNVERGLQRASAVLILNDGTTGFPYACIEGGLISAVRTTVSAAVGLYHLNARHKDVGSVGIVGTGFIARNLVDCLAKLNWQIGAISLYDIDRRYAEAMRDHIKRVLPAEVSVVDDLDSLFAASEVIVTTTTAGQPYIESRSLLAHNPIILNISLRDFSADIILSSNNIVDDVDHCLKANTSPHLAFLKSGNKDFINGHFGDLLAGRIVIDTSRPTILSPFGLGVLDLAVGRFVYEELLKRGDITAFEDFFGEYTRW